MLSQLNRRMLAEWMHVFVESCINHYFNVNRGRLAMLDGRS
jgi:hypothetical protein